MSSPKIRLDDAQNYLERMIAALRGQTRLDNHLLVAILDQISQYVQVTKREIASLRSTDRNEQYFATASDELTEVVAEAAKATNEIISAAEAIERLDPAGEGSAAAINDAVTRIYVACAFQDITGQRVAKVIRTLNDIQTKIALLATACGEAVEQRAMEATPLAASSDSHLLNGPQVAAQAQSQEDIDKLFESAN